MLSRLVAYTTNLCNAGEGGIRTSCGMWVSPGAAKEWRTCCASPGITAVGTRHQVPVERFVRSAESLYQGKIHQVTNIADMADYFQIATAYDSVAFYH